MKGPNSQVCAVSCAVVSAVALSDAVAPAVAAVPSSAVVLAAAVEVSGVLAVAAAEGHLVSSLPVSSVSQPPAVFGAPADSSLLLVVVSSVILLLVSSCKPLLAVAGKQEWFRCKAKP